MPDGTVVRDSLEIVMHVNNLPATVPRPTLIPEDLSALLAIEKTIHFMYHLIGNQLVVGVRFPTLPSCITTASPANRHVNATCSLCTSSTHTPGI